MILANGQNEYFKVDDEAFLKLLDDNLFCKVGKPIGKEETYYSLVLNCAYQNQEQFVESCRKIAMGCLESEDIKHSVLEVLAESPQVEKENLKRAHQVAFTSIELNPEMQILIKECTTEHAVKEQWFWNPRKSNACNNYYNATQ